MVNIVLHYASESDISHVLEVEKAMEKVLGGPLEEYDVYVDRRCASAHKTPEYLVKAVAGTGDCDVRGVILGRQPAAPPAIDASGTQPVITYLTDGKGNPDQIYSSLNVPSGVGCMTAPPWPGGMALALLKVAAVKDKELKSRIFDYQLANTRKVMDADERYKGRSFKEAAKIHEERKKKK